MLNTDKIAGLLVHGQPEWGALADHRKYLAKQHASLINKMLLKDVL